MYYWRKNRVRKLCESPCVRVYKILYLLINYYFNAYLIVFTIIINYNDLVGANIHFIFEILILSLTMCRANASVKLILQFSLHQSSQKIKFYNNVFADYYFLACTKYFLATKSLFQTLLDALYFIFCFFKRYLLYIIYVQYNGVIIQKG